MYDFSMDDYQSYLILSIRVQKDVSEHGGTPHTRDQLQIVMRCSWHILLYVSGGVEENEVE